MKNKYVVLFLFLPTILLSQGSIYKAAEKCINDSVNFQIKKYKVIEWFGYELNYQKITANIFSVMSKVNKVNGTHFEVKEKNGLVEACDKKLGVLGKMICFKQSSNQIVFYAQGWYKYKNIPVPGKAFFVLNYHKEEDKIINQLSFYLEPDGDIVKIVASLINFLSDDEVDKNINTKAEMILKIAIDALQIVSQQGF